jgi:Periplasmic copper-binding protein (NosD)
MRVIRRVVTIGAVAGVILGATTATASAHASVVRPGQSIQAAVDAAAPGSTVVVGRGTFHESVLITKALRLVGSGPGTVLEPGGPPSDCAPNGICAFSPSGKVSISNLTVRGFDGFGIFAFQATKGFSVTGVRAENDGEYGVAAFESHGISFVGNFASNAEEAGFYVGDTEDAAGLIAANTSVDSAFGIFLRDSRHGQVVGNRVSGNCVGILGLDTNSTTSTGDDVSAGDWRLLGNKVLNNSKACPPNEEAPPLSGLGVAIVGPDNYLVTGNLITGNTPSGPSAFQGGVAVVDSTPFGGSTPNGNVVKANVIKGNDPDIFWDGSGRGNVFAHNLCKTSVPSGLC